MADYRYIFGTLRSESVVEEIPMYGVYMDLQLNRGGQFQGTFQLDQTGKNNESLMDACIPGRTWVACERSGVCIWHGFIWSRVYSAQSKSVQLFALSFENYPKKRIILQDTSFTNIEQRNIFRSLWTQMQADTGSNLNIEVPGSFTNAVLKSIDVLATDYKYYDSVMSTLADGDDGFDWYIQVTKDGVFYRKNLAIGYPTIGTGETPGMTVFDYPGNITQYYLTEPMSESATHIFVIGTGEGSSMIVGEFAHDDLIASGHARWDMDISRKDANKQSIADSLAAQQGTIRRPPVPVIKMTVKADKTPEFGSYSLGDACRIVINDPRFPGVGMNSVKRLIKWELHPPSETNTEEVDLVFEGDPNG